MPSTQRSKSTKNKGKAGGGSYEVECILNHSDKEDGRVYLTKWKGFPKDDASWLDRGRFDDTTIIDEYDKSVGTSKDECASESTAYHSPPQSSKRSNVKPGRKNYPRRKKKATFKKVAVKNEQETGNKRRSNR